MKKTSIVSAISGVLVAGSLVLAGPAAARTGHDAGDGSASPSGGQSSSSTRTATGGQIGVGIFTGPAPVGQAEAAGVLHTPTVGAELPLAPVGQAEAAGTQKTVVTAPAYAPAPVAAPAGGVSDARVGICNGCELPIAPIG